MYPVVLTEVINELLGVDVTLSTSAELRKKTMGVIQRVETHSDLLSGSASRRWIDTSRVNIGIAPEERNSHRVLVFSGELLFIVGSGKDSQTWALDTVS